MILGLGTMLIAHPAVQPFKFIDTWVPWETEVECLPGQWTLITNSGAEMKIVPCHRVTSPFLLMGLMLQ